MSAGAALIVEDDANIQELLRLILQKPFDFSLLEEKLQAIELRPANTP